MLIKKTINNKICCSTKPRKLISGFFVIKMFKHLMLATTNQSSSIQQRPTNHRRKNRSSENFNNLYKSYALSLKEVVYCGKIFLNYLFKYCYNQYINKQKK